MQDEARRLLGLFEGSAEAHGTYRSDGTSTAVAGKVEIKSSARTVREPTTEDTWLAHLSGTTPLGIIPLRADDTIVWACGDVDQYDVIHSEIATKIKELKLPLIVTKSKSGGAHVFLFLSRPASPAAVQIWMRHQMARLGHGSCEVFPKQTRILRERGDLGNWIVMPYFGQSQEAIRPSGGAYTLAEFVREAERQRTDPDTLTITPPRHANGSGAHPDAPIGDGPPCLQHLVVAGFPEGTRNKGLFALGVYAKKRWPEDWERHLEELNQQSMRPPLPADEVATVVRSLKRRDYLYTCRDIPLVNHCNAPLCQTRLYGIGSDGGGAIPTISGLTVLETDPPIWFVDIGEERLELSTEQLLNYRMFQKVCAEQLYQIWRTIKQDTWLSMVGRAMDTVSRIEVSEDASVGGHFREILEEFCTNRTRGDKPEDMLSRRAYYCEKEGRYYFRLQDLERQVDHTKMGLSRAEITSRIKALGGDKHFFNVKGRGLNTWWISHDVVEPRPPADLPYLKPEVM